MTDTDIVITAEADLLAAVDGAERLYTDCVAHARLIAGAWPAVRIRTFSPAVADAVETAEPAYAGLTPDRFDAMARGASAVAEAFRAAFWDRDPDLATCLAYATFDRLHRNLYKAICLEDADFTVPTVVLQPHDLTDTAFRETFCSPLEVLIGDRSNVRILHVDRSLFPNVDDPRPPKPSFAVRLRFASWKTMAYRLITLFWRKVKRGGPAGSALILRENELVKETGLALAFRGVALKLTGIPGVPDSEISPHPAEAEITERARTACAVAFSALMPEPAVAAVAERLVRDSIAAAREFEAMTEAWTRKLAALKAGGAGRLRCALTNLIGATQLSALHRALRRDGVPLCLFQHGVTMEYHATHHRYAAQYETASSDIAVTFNDRGARVANGTRYRQGDAVAAGMPQDYFASRNIAPNPAAPPVWYICTALYLGNRGTLFEGVNDGDKNAFETRLVDRVLSKLPHRVAYKPYPGRRFFDPQPEEVLATEAANITLIRERIDMRYLFKDARILVTSRSFSTPSWCVMSGRPVVYIHIPHQAPLTEEAKQAFAEGLFLFDATDPDFDVNLHRFLSQPIEAIEAAYREKQAARDRLVEDYFTAWSGGAGRRAAAAVLQRSGATPDPVR